MPKLICWTCQTALIPHRNGVYLIEMALKPPQPYKIWSCDIWKCPVCNSKVAAGFPNKPLTEHHEGEKFQRYLDIARKDNPLYEYERDKKYENLES